MSFSRYTKRFFIGCSNHLRTLFLFLADEISDSKLRRIIVASTKPKVIVRYILLFWVGCIVLGLFSMLIGKGNATGTFGDFFGSINAIFSGAALAGVIFSLMLQRKELRLQRREMQLTRSEMEDQKKVMHSQQAVWEAQHMNSLFFSLFDSHSTIKSNISGGRKSSKVSGYRVFNTAKLALEAITGEHKKETDHAIKNDSLLGKQVEHYRKNYYTVLDKKFSACLNNSFAFDCYAASLEQLFHTTLSHNKNTDEYLDIIIRSISLEEEIILFFLGTGERFTLLKHYIEIYSLCSHLDTFQIPFEKLERYRAYTPSAFTKKSLAA